MTRPTIFAAAATIATAAFSFGMSSSASASNCAMDNYDHNGSVMGVTFCDYSMHISYDMPHKVLVSNGVSAGTLLIDAKTWGNGYVKGNARVFKRGCGGLAYKVQGRIYGDGIELSGVAPVRDSDCSIVRFRNDHLVFEKL